MDATIITHDHYPIWDGDLATLVSGIGAGRTAIILDCSNSKGFANDLNLANVLIIMAARGQTWESSALEHGIFTYWFVFQGIIEGKADDPNFNPYATQDDKIPFEEAYDYAFRNMKRQKPIIVDNVDNDMYPTSVV